MRLYNHLDYARILSITKALIFHLHLRYAGDNDELYFRDYLIEFPDIAREYEKLKLSLWEEYEHNRDAYTNAKTEFVKKYTEKAKSIYGNRYLT